VSRNWNHAPARSVRHIDTHHEGKTPIMKPQVFLGLLFWTVQPLLAQMQGMQHGHSMSMQSAVIHTVPENRDGSGTSWVPDASAMHALHDRWGDWRVMLHGELSLRFTGHDLLQSGTRGGSRIDGPNWVMGMASRPVGDAAQVAVRTMLSLDRATEGGAGYPLLFQSGESWNGRRLVDSQHPHDLFMELAAMASFSMGKVGTVGLYLAYPGEPALGPPAFMHRPSARMLLDAPLSHHWQDATHISFGVATLGWQWEKIKLEGSVFTGREPDENRWEFDRATMDSYSARLSFNPTDDLALQVSRGFLRTPEPLEPGVDRLRTTASVLHVQPGEDGGAWSIAFVWGMNTAIGAGSQQSFLVESGASLGPQLVFGRVEVVDKSGEELDLDGMDHDLFTVIGLTLGTARTFWSSELIEASVGIQAGVTPVPSLLQPIYGKLPVSLSVFLCVAPPHMGEAMPGMHHH
jgi:hypothetical protein